MKVTTDACLFGAWCARLLQREKAETLLDVGTGTGLLPLMIAQQKTLRMDAVEIDGAAARQARQNVEASAWRETISVHQADVLNMGNLKSYDAIISNPPFYEGDLHSPDQRRNTAYHSRHLTLRALIQLIALHLNAGGLFFLLLPCKRRTEACGLLQEHRLAVHKEMLVRQTPGHAPFRTMLQGGFEKKEHETETIAITKGANQYTPAFAELLKAYYLYL